MIRKSIPLLIIIGLVIAVSLMAGLRYGILLLIGIGFGATLEGLRFGFAGPWRAMILNKNPSGLLAQLLCIALVASVAFPLLANNGTELSGAHAPVGLAMVLGAFAFGAAMQVVLGCGSGTLVNAGSGNAVALVALPFFALGSFLGASHLVWWSSIASAPLVVLSGTSGLLFTLLALVVTAVAALYFAAPGTRKLPVRLLFAAVIIAALALLNLVVAGQPWGVVYGLGLWGGKVALAAGADLSTNAFWSNQIHQTRLSESLLTDVTSLTNLGIFAGAFIIAKWRDGLAVPLARYPLKAWIATIIAGLVLGYSSRLAFGCNVGAFFSGISTGSLHGWVWFIAAFAGSYWGIGLRKAAGLTQ